MTTGPELPVDLPSDGDQGPPVHVPCNRAIGLLGDLLEGALDPSTERDLRAHLAVCPPCVTFLHQLEQTRALVGRLPDAAELPEQTQELLVREFGRFLSPGGGPGAGAGGPG
jgi:hypothetical protein